MLRAQKINDAETVTRCRWCGGDPLAEQYHDHEWGAPIGSDSDFLERLSLEVFQAGLSWRTILHKRDAFRQAFCGFDPVAVAGFTSADVDRLMADASIVRNRLKIEATVQNAGVVSELAARYGSAAGFMNSLSRLDENDLIRVFKKRFRFMGPAIAVAFFQAVGRLPAPHDPECFMSAPGAAQQPQNG